MILLPLISSYISVKNLPGQRSGPVRQTAHAKCCRLEYKKIARAKPAMPDHFQSEELLLLNYLENNGYPFAKISLDSVEIQQGAIQGVLNIEKGPLI